MPRPSKISKPLEVETVCFIPASSIGFSDQGWEDINNSSNVTFGDANRTLYTAERLNERVTFTRQSDQKKLDKIIALDQPVYIDLEN